MISISPLPTLFYLSLKPGDSCMPLAVLLTLYVVWAAFGCLGVYVAIEKGRSPLEGTVFGFVFGPVGVIVLAPLPTLDTPRRGGRYGRAAGHSPGGAPRGGPGLRS